MKRLEVLRFGKTEWEDRGTSEDPEIFRSWVSRLVWKLAPTNDDRAQAFRDRWMAENWNRLVRGVMLSPSIDLCIRMVEVAA